MLDYAPPNTDKQKKLLTQKANDLAQEAWRTAEPWWLNALRRCSAPDVFEADSAIASVPLRVASFLHKRIHERFGRANDADEARADAFSVAILNPFEEAFGAFLGSKDSGKPIHHFPSLSRSPLSMLLTATSIHGIRSATIPSSNFLQKQSSMKAQA
jgi:hypothetical protein